MTDEWLSLKGAAELLGVHPSTVRLWSDKGVLPTASDIRVASSLSPRRSGVVGRDAREARVEPGKIMQYCHEKCAGADRRSKT